MTMKTTLITSVLFVIAMLFSTGASSQTGTSVKLPQFLFPEFSAGKVKLKTGSQSVSLNYNTIDEEMIFSQRGSYMALTNLSDIDTVIIQARKFVPVGKPFYEVVVSKDIPFFIQHKSKYASEGTATAYGMTSQVNERTNATTMKSAGQIRTLEMPDNVKVVPETIYWVRVNNEMKKFTSERQLLKIFAEKEDDLKKFIKGSSIDISDREDLIKLGVYCNEIVK
jgi:hypothetical protein